jgi:hypothetical protein
LEKNQLDSVFYYTQKAIEIADASKNDTLRGQMQMRLADYYRFKADDFEALKHVKYAQELYKKVNYVAGQVDVIFQLFSFSFDYNDFQTIDDKYPLAIYLSRQINSPTEPLFHYTKALGFQLIDGRKNGDSLLYYSDLMIEAGKRSKIEKFVLMGITCKSIGYTFIGDYKNAEIQIKIAERLNSVNPLFFRTYDIKYAWFRLYVATKNVEGATKIYNEIDSMLKPGIGDPSSMYQLRYQLDSLKKDYEGAFFNFYKCEAIQKKTFLERSTKILQNLQTNIDYSNTKDINKALLTDSYQKENRLLRQQRSFGILTSVSIIVLLIIWMIYFLSRKKQKIQIEETNLRNELRLIKSQLSPHFINNAFSLLSINLPDNPSGEKNRLYISKLSVYFKKILDITYKDTHTLEDELIFEEEFIQLQQQLLPSKFEYFLDIDPDFNTYGIDIPTMLLQPFIENCIKHGFQNIDYTGLITIRCFAENGSPIIEIEDNGIGLTESNTNKSTGLGISISMKRLKIFTKNKISNKDLISISNLSDKHGCLVRINLPQNI